MITVKNISYHIGNKLLLNDINVEFKPNKLNLIIGPNGAGIQAQQGHVYYNQVDIKNTSSINQAKIRAVLSQNTDLAFPLKVSEVVMMGRYPHFIINPTSNDKQACQEAMRFFDVDDMKERNYLTLSGGEKQRVQFARVMAQIWLPSNDDCRYLILDEPLSFLDIHYQIEFMNKIMELLNKSNLVVVGVVHDLNLCAKYAHQITLLNKATIYANGTKEDVLNKENIKAVYHLEPIIYNENNDLRLFF
jgi:iron complex transport system ATP-binding protein